MIVFHLLVIYTIKLWLLGGLGWPILFLSLRSLLLITLESLLDIVQHTSIPHLLGRTTLVITHLRCYSLLCLGNIINYQSWILWQRYNHSHVFHPRLLQVCDWNIQYCHNWLNHTRFGYSWQLSISIFLFQSCYLFLYTSILKQFWRCIPILFSDASSLKRWNQTIVSAKICEVNHCQANKTPKLIITYGLHLALFIDCFVNNLSIDKD